ncbi:MAG TPA: hypothetical protein VLC92_01255 [Rhodocyclaceae bacterium]|nr:hypothetical protein [Rhodocyclaceae bacterium]
MADWIDQSVETAEQLAAVALAKRKPEGPEPTGQCLCCGKPMRKSKTPRRWCDADCRDDWQADENAKSLRAHG